MVTYKTKEVKVKQVVAYGGHSITANGLVNLTLKATYSELVNTIQLTQMLNNDIILGAKTGGKTKRLGVFRIKQLIIDGDGDSKIKLSGDTNFVETDEVNNLPLNTDDVQEFIVLYKSEVEYEVEVEDDELDDADIPI